MTNANTEHSKKLRIATAAAQNKKMRESGKVKQIGLALSAELAAEFDAILSELGANRAEGIKALCEFYRLHNK